MPIILLLLLGSLALNAQAQSAKPPEQKFYDVEIIIFKNLTVPKGHEYHLPTPAAEHSVHTLDLFDPSQMAKAAKQGFSVLPIEDLKLLEEDKKIVRSSRYELLAHVGWRQPGLEKSRAIPVWIHGGKIFDKRYSSIDQSETAPDSRATITGNSLPEGNNQLPSGHQGLYELEGAITITLARYLHTQAELVLRKPATLDKLLQRAALPETEIALDQQQILLNYGLKEHRRMRSKRLHYLDSPEFGMLVLITPYQKPEPAPEVETVDPAQPVAADSTTSAIQPASSRKAAQ